jgi:hypothetical protein
MMKPDRRNFLKFVGLGSAAVFIPSCSDSYRRDSPQPICLGRNESLADSLKTDVLVIGAGSSGIPAAIAAARTGAKVILIEEDMIPGGGPVDNYVAMLCGGPRVGIFKEMVDLLDMEYDLTGTPLGERWHERWFMPSAWLQVITRKLKAESNLHYMGGRPVVNVLLSEGGRRNIIRGVSVPSPDGKTANIEADIVIDATGTGIVATIAGCQYLYGTEAKTTYNEPIGPDKSSLDVQSCTLMLVSQRLDPEAKIDLEKLKAPRDPGAGLVGREPIELIRKRNIGTYLHWAGTVRCKDTRDPEELCRSHLKAMEAIEDDVAYLVENGYIAHIAPKLGVRETRRVIGDKILTINDLINPNWPDDVIAMGKYGIDSWGASYLKDQKITLPENGYGLPYGMLVNRDMENLFVVGKCVSATHLGMSAVRVQPIVSQMGQAAGTAAAMCINNKTDIRSVDMTRLQQKLKEAGMLSGV